MENISQMSLLEVALYIMEQKKGKQVIKNLIKEVLEMKGIDDEDGSIATQLYIDITTSSKFVYMGDGEWDLKSRQSLDEYDKDGSAFNPKDIVEEDDEEFDYEMQENEEDDELDDELVDVDDDDDDDEYGDYDDYDDDDDEYGDYDDYDDGEVESIIDDDLIERYSEDDFNEDKYNDLMDDYEDMYEE